MAKRFSDDELREALKEYGEDVGPITPTTRPVLERRLTTLRKSRSPLSRRTRLNALSSDDSEIENSSSSHRRKRNSVNHQVSSERSERSNLSFPLSPSSSHEDSFKKPLARLSPAFTIQGKNKFLERSSLHNNHNFAGRVKKNSERHAAFSVDTSDSDFDTDSSPSKSYRPTRKKLSRSSSESKTISPSQNSHSQLNFDNNFRKKSFNLDSSTETKLPHLSPSANRFKKDAHQDYHVNGYISNNLSNGVLNEERLDQGSSTNYSHCISWLLVVGAATFFIIIGLVYITELHKTSQMASKSYVKFCEGVKKENCENLILLSSELHHLLTTVAGIYDCSADTENLKRNMTVPEARMAMKNIFIQNGRELDEFDNLFIHSVFLLKRIPDTGIKFYSLLEEEGSQSLENLLAPQLDFSALEAAQGFKSLWCRIRLSLKWTVTKIILFFCVGFLIFLCCVCTKFWKKRKEAQEKMFYEMVEQVIDILQETSDWPAENESYKAVVKIRDAIIPLKERKNKLWLWDRVVAFIEENESRVSVEYRTINGEDFKVWKWQQFASTENESGKQGKVWQGQAFSSLGKGKNTMYSLSPCLKIRNMFDSEVEYDDGWQVNIQDAILEKCEGNDGIRHIAIDTSNNEGCVYMLCSSTDAAGKAFNDLHGWWFDSKLVTVKYLPYKRYLEHFPESKHCTEPLRPSNNKRLSLSTPFFSSALERS